MKLAGIDSVQESSNVPARTLLHNWAYMLVYFDRPRQLLATFVVRRLVRCCFATQPAKEI
jgi:hypothetical protein